MPTPPLFDRLPPPLAEALLDRGFTELTPVQARVLDPAFDGVDLRVSSQTGSGKTVAIGLVLAPALIELAAAPPPATRGARPHAVLIAPTRELAAQLARELSWLYAKLRVGVAVVAGGASYRDEKRALSQRPLVVVGTPGRLKDHLERRSIDTSGVATVVLDEADRMLDLGFREELEAILGLLPPERRTHLMSATFPREVLALANRYQRDAIVVEGTDLGAANSDITYVAHLVHQNERESALVNLLMMAPGERTLLFVRTRADASELADRLTRAGFHSLPLSGELEQRDRNKTLEAFRLGVVSTLVATDVAARGLDIPDVGRVIHCDPPTDSDGLTHRSGRTGRAGRKGTSVILVPPSGRVRVESIMRRARVKATWLPVPSPREVRAAIDNRLSTELAAVADTHEDRRLDALAERLLDELESEDAGPAPPRSRPARRALRAAGGHADRAAISAARGSPRAPRAKAAATAGLGRLRVLPNQPRPPRRRRQGAHPLHRLSPRRREGRPGGRDPHRDRGDDLRDREACRRQVHAPDRAAGSAEPDRPHRARRRGPRPAGGAKGCPQAGPEVAHRREGPPERSLRHPAACLTSARYMLLRTGFMSKPFGK